MPFRIYSMSLAPPRSSTMQHLKQELRYTQTDKQPPKRVYLGINLVLFAEFSHDCGREPFVRDARVALLQIANRRTNGWNPFSDDVLLSNTDTKMLVNPISRRKVQGVLRYLLFQSLMEKISNVACVDQPKESKRRSTGKERKLVQKIKINNTSSGRNISPRWSSLVEINMVPWWYARSVTIL